jgi:hypothetical protein
MKFDSIEFIKYDIYSSVIYLLKMLSEHHKAVLMYTFNNIFCLIF